MKNEIKRLDEKLFIRCINGATVFFPWGYPGEGFLLDEQGLKKTRMLFSSFFYFIAAYIAIVVLLDRLDDLRASSHDYLMLTCYAFALPLYVLLMHITKKGRDVYVMPRNERPRKLIFMVYASFLFIGQIYWLINFRGDMLAGLHILYISGTLFSLYIYAKVLITRGHYFSA